MAGKATTPREWALAIGGGLGFAAALVWLLRGATEAPLPPTTPPVTATPLSAAAPAPQMPAPPPVTAAPDLQLAGLRAGPDGGMAIVIAGGRQYLLRPGRSLPGGVRLLRVEPGRAIMAGPGGEMVLTFADARQASAPPPAAETAPTAWQLALSPLQSQSGQAGWRVDSLTAVPEFARAGLQIGDVVTAANGSDLISEEKIMELPQELSKNGRLRLAYMRGTQRREAIITR